MAETLRKWWLPGWLFALYFIYPIPHTIALRNLLLVTGLASCLWIIRGDHSGPQAWRKLASFRTSGWMLAILSCWLLFQSSFISPYPGLALDMLRGDWLNELLVAFIGGCAVLAMQRSDARRGIAILTVALFAHALLLFFYQIWLWISGGGYPSRLTPFANIDYHSTLLTALVALLLGDLSSRLIAGRAALAISSRTEILMLFLALVTTIILTARNAVIISFVLLVLTAAVFFLTGRRRLGRWVTPAILAVFLVSSIVGWIGLRSDPRWEGFVEAATAAFDTQSNRSWLDGEKYAPPLTKSGQPVEESAYLRLAWAKVAVEQIERYPLGLGYGHKAFGWAVNRSYNLQTGHESSHSGLLDFTLANGIPGLLLWLAFSAALIVAGWRAFRKDGSPAGLMLVFSVVAYLVRCTVDGHLSGFRLEMFALLVGVLVVTQALESEPCS